MLRKLDFKVIFCLLLLLFSLTVLGVGIRADEEVYKKPPVAIQAKNKLRFAAWNIEAFGYRDKKGKSTRGDYQLRIISRIISQYDLMVITEFMDREIEVDKGKVKGLKKGSEGSDFLKLLEFLPKKYDHRISETAGRGHSGMESYAFLFNTEFVKVVTEGEMYEDKGEIYNDGMDDFTRDPYWITFRARNFDFTVIAVHIYFGDGSKASIKRRRKEIRALAKVYEGVQKTDDQEQDILLVGDFNMAPIDDSFKPLRKDKDYGVVPLFEIDNGDVSNLAATAMLYDNIFFEEKHLVHEYLDSAIDKLQLTLFYGDRTMARQISNHLPVTAEFRIDRDDDDPINAESTEQ